MAVKERKQITGTTAQIQAYKGHEGQIVWDKDKKTFVGMSGTAGKNYPLAPQAYVDNEVSKVNEEVAKKASSAELTSGLAGKEDKGVCIPLAGHTDIPGQFAFSNRDPIKATTDSSIIAITGGTSWDKGAQIILEGTGHSDVGGSAEVVARRPDGTGVTLRVSTDGFSYLDNKKVSVVHSSGGDWIRFTNGLQIVFMGFSYHRNFGAEWVNFPVPFKYAPNVQANCWFGSDSEAPNISSSDFSNVTNTACSVRVRSIDSYRLGYDCGCFVLAVGYWL